MSRQKSESGIQKSESWRPLRDSNPCCRRERAGAFAESRQISDKSTGIPIHISQWLRAKSLKAGQPLLSTGRA